MRMLLAIALLAVLLGTGVAPEAAAAPPDAEPDYAAELPRLPPVEAKQALATFRVQPGFRLDLVAAEPHVASPVAVCWDERGRMYVVEMRGYSERRDEKLSRVRLLTDTDGDGVYDDARIFSAGLLWPTAILCWQGGVFVGDAPDILYLKDTDGDGVADERTRVYTGFGTQNVQGLLNSFHWGLDNRVHGATSTNGGEVRFVGAGQAGPPRALRGRDFSFDPRNPADLRPESGGGQHGMSFDDWGHKFVCANSDHAQQIVLEDCDLARSAAVAPPLPRISIAADGPQAAVFRASPIEPWRILRTRLRVAGQAPGPIEGGGRPAGYFTGATGITVVRGDAFDDAVRGTLVVGDVGSNLVHRKRLRLSGLRYTAERIDHESELVASTDTWFRPAQFAHGPDGGLTIIDVYREVIEHPASLPPPIKRHLDLDSGRDRGRIYRLAPADYRPRPAPRLDRAGTAELVDLLGHRNAWHRETAARLLYERQPEEAVPRLLHLLAAEAAPLAKSHALHALAGQGAGFRAADRLRALAAAIDDPHPRVREQALRLADDVLREALPAADDKADLAAARQQLTDRLLARGDEPDAQVRFRLALACARLPSPRREGLLLAILQRDLADPYLRWAIVPHLAIDRLASDAALRTAPELQSALLLLAEQAGRELAAEQRAGEKQAAVHRLIALLAATPEAERVGSWRLLQALERGLGDRRAAVLAPTAAAEIAQQADRIRAAGRRAATALATNPQGAEGERCAALWALGGSEWESLRALAAALLVPHEPPQVQVALVQVLGERTEAEVVDALLAAWPRLSPGLRRAASGVLVGRPERAARLLAAIDERRFAAAELDAAAIAILQAHPSPALRQQAARHFAPRSDAARAALLERYRPALEQAGDPARGKAHFAKVCAACHRLEGTGTEIGPSLAAMRNRGPEAILLNVLDPNREVNPQYLTYLVTTVDGRTLTGLVTGETATSLTLRFADGRSETLLRSTLEDFRGPGLSFMPEGLEQQLDVAAMADLLAYLMSVK